jgi:threonine-phosphate decarboxylase
MHRFLPPWSVSTLAQVAGSYCLRQNEYRQRTLRVVMHERAIMEKCLRKLAGFRVYSGRANYLLMEMDATFPTARELQEDLLKHERILVRDCASFEGLGDRYVRVAVRLPRQNSRLLAALGRWSGERGCVGDCS